MPFIHIHSERWQKPKSLYCTPTHRAVRNKILRAIDHELMRSVEDKEIGKQWEAEQREALGER
jgi:hypothetical protein